MPLAKDRVNTISRLDVRYNKIMALIGADGDPAKQGDKYQRYRRELLGQQVLHIAPPQFWDIRSIMALGYNEDSWSQLDIHTRSRMKAVKIIDGMVDIVERHDRLQEEKIKNLGQKRGV